jgi:hypothetical protein
MILQPKKSKVDVRKYLKCVIEVKNFCYCLVNYIILKMRKNSCIFYYFYGLPESKDLLLFSVFGKWCLVLAVPVIYNIRIL